MDFLKVSLVICSLTVGTWSKNASYAQSSVVFDKIQKSLLQSSVNEITPYFGDFVEIGWDETKKNYERSQAIIVLKEFIKKNPPSAFEFVHKGSSKEGLQYGIGKYTSKSGFWRLYILVKEVKGSFLIDTMDFSKE